jgi:iron complex outermembrane recepter protein
MQKSSFIRAALFASISLGAIATLPAAAIAQDEAMADEGEGGDEIIVTARRREESLQDVPVAVTAYSGAQLEAAGATDITDINDTTPNVTVENSRGTNSTLTAFIRGVGQQDPVSGFESGVGIYLDDVYLNRPQAAVLDIYDVERIEILRGPQGTLYGRNTIGGAIKYVTKRLPQEFALKARASYGTYDQADAVLTASAPLGDLVRIGGSVARLSRGGFGDNLNLPGVENYNKDVWAARASFELGGYGEPVFIRVSGDYTRDKSDPRNGHRLVTSLLTGAPVLNDVYDNRAGLANPKQDVKAYGFAINASAELSDTITLKSISAFRKDRSFTPIDFDALPSVDVDVPAVYRNEQTSQEFQLLYEGERLNGLVGFYYLDAKSATQFDVILATTGTLLALPGLNAYTEGDVRTKTWSVFGDFTFDLSEQFAISVGGRYTSDTRRSTILRQTKIGGASPIFGGTAIPIATITNFTGSAKFTDFNPRASLSFKPNEDHLLYASYAQGFKGGSFDPRGDARIAVDTDRNGIRSYQEIYDFFLFDPETVDSYELGWKGSFGGARFAVTGFYGDYKNVQIPGSVGVDANNDGIFESFAGVTTNAAKATFKGIEIETFARFARDFAGDGSALTFTGTLGYIDGEFDRYIVNNVDVSNLRRIQNTPKWTASATLGLELGAFAGQATYSYRSKTNQFEVPSPFLDQPSYGLFDASLTWSSDDDRFSLGLHGKNLFDKQYITSGYQFLSVAADGTPLRTGTGALIPSLGREGVVTAFYGNPRQVFVTAGFKF